MATCRECLHQELCDTYARMGVTDVPTDDITICELFKPKSDYVKRERGEWRIYIDDEGCAHCDELYEVVMQCSVCNGTAIGTYDFCPDCGADMRKEQI